MQSYYFDDQHIKWEKLDGFEHFVFTVLDVDKENNIIDVLYKFDANKQIVLHRHCTLNKLFVIQGEHRLYEPNGKLKEIRHVGSYTSVLPDKEAHREGGGSEQDVIILFSIRGSGLLYEVLDDDMNVIGELTEEDFIEIYEKNLENA